MQPKKSPAPTKQSSEDDEISRIKKQNKANPQAEAVEERPAATPTPVAREPETEDRRPVARLVIAFHLYNSMLLLSITIVLCN